MLIGGIQKLSLVDYPGKSSIALFTIGCNMRCGWCHNKELVDPQFFAPSLDEDQVLKFIKSRIGLVQSVTISGGECTLQPDLIDFVKKIKAMGFFVKIDSNGSNPQIISDLLTQNLIDFIAMDIKSTWQKYNLTAGAEMNHDRIKQSIKIIKNSKINFEFRTTIVKSLHQIDDFDKIGKMLTEDGRKIPRFALQHFRPGKTIDPKFATDDTFSEAEFEKAHKIMIKYADKVVIH